MKPSEVLRAAGANLAHNDATFWEGHRGCCGAIKATRAPSLTRALDIFRGLFMPPGANHVDFWFGNEIPGSDIVEENQYARFMALELAALIAEEHGE